ncbi:MAG: DnaJ domain-containing protein [Proteobacteria bacterium]|nr:DnaJ domain-containing protein [Pseudomonadota bacterium]
MKTGLKIILTVLGLAYVVSPYDVVPDFLPILGQADDLFVMGLLLFYLMREPLSMFLLGRRRGASAERLDSGRSGPKDLDRSASARLNPYEVLNLAPGANPAEIRRAYREACQNYHPDKVSHLGPELQALAKRKFLEVQRAYEFLRRRGGW